MNENDRFSPVSDMLGRHTTDLLEPGEKEITTLTSSASSASSSNVKRFSEIFWAETTRDVIDNKVDDAVDAVDVDQS